MNKIKVVGSNIIEASGTSSKGLSVTTYMVIEIEDDQIKVKPVTVKVTEMFNPTTRLKIILDEKLKIP